MSAELKATPGPWTVHPLMAWVSPLADLDMPICQMRMATDKVSCEPQALADAKLIAAAPALYEALVYVRENLGDPVPIGRRHVARRIDEALKLARGES